LLENLRSLLVCVVKFSNESKMYWFFVNQSKFSSSIWVHHTTFDGCNFRRLYLFHPMFIFNKICWIMFHLKSSYCGKNSMSIQVVLNVWEQFKIQNPNIFGLQWILAACFFFIQCVFLMGFLEKLHILV